MVDEANSLGVDVVINIRYWLFAVMNSAAWNYCLWIAVKFKKFYTNIFDGVIINLVMRVVF